jgi:hypothetical protein
VRLSENLTLPAIAIDALTIASRGIPWFGETGTPHAMFVIPETVFDERGNAT